MREKNSLPQVYFARNYLVILAFVIPMTVIYIFFLGIYTIPMIISLNNGLRLTSYEIWSAIILNILILGLTLFAWIMGCVEGSIEFTKKHVRKKGIFRYTIIKWAEVTSVYMIGARITIQSQSKKLQINTVYFREPDKLIRFIQDQLSSQST